MPEPPSPSPHQPGLGPHRAAVSSARAVGSRLEWKQPEGKLYGKKYNYERTPGGVALGALS